MSSTAVVLAGMWLIIMSAAGMRSLQMLKRTGNLPDARFRAMLRRIHPGLAVSEAFQVRLMRAMVALCFTAGLLLLLSAAVQ